MVQNISIFTAKFHDFVKHLSFSGVQSYNLLQEKAENGINSLKKN